ncbi:MAG: large subunit ribosomal protein, partial [Patescibacteria group bacterium]|nr:large subunit ribosomal protein [Patescibacteria group bacterium]
EEHVAVVRPGTILFELSGVTQEIAEQAFSKAGHKLSVKTILVQK